MSVVLDSFDAVWTRDPGTGGGVGGGHQISVSRDNLELVLCLEVKQDVLCLTLGTSH